MKTAKQQLLQSSKSEQTGKEQSNSSSLNKPEENIEQKTEIIPIPKTPFTLIRFSDKANWMISIGNNQVVTETFKTINKAKRYIARKPWMLILTASMIINKNNK